MSASTITPARTPEAGVYPAGGANFRTSGEVTLIIADPLPISAAGLQALSRLHIATRATWTVESVEEAFRVADGEPGAVVFIDRAFGCQDVLEAIRQLDGIPVIVCGNSLTEGEVLRFLHAGAKGVVSKSGSVESIFACIREVAAGGTWTGVETQARTEYQQGLTPRQKQIAGLVVQGLKNREIGAELGMKPGTVKVHLRNIFERTGCRGRIALSIAIKQGEL